MSIAGKSGHGNSVCPYLVRLGMEHCMSIAGKSWHGNSVFP